VIAQEAIKRKTGARGLRSILEKAMLDIMYETPSNNNIQEVVISENTITQGVPPKLIMRLSADNNRKMKVS
jgi:ATP-dependent Clp protease ATP-binding subunit ClpX